MECSYGFVSHHDRDQDPEAESKSGQCRGTERDPGHCHCVCGHGSEAAQWTVDVAPGVERSDASR